MRLRSACLALVPVLAALSAPGVSAAAPKHKHKKKKGPTLQQQITADVAQAERSADLWATVNVCMSAVTTSTGTEDVVGVRGQMPGLGLVSDMTMSIAVEYWNYNDNMFETAGSPTLVDLGQATHGVHQGGVNFPFAPPTMGSTYLVRGTITFSWKISGKVVGSVTRNTGHGYANVGFSNPPGTSEGTCTLM